MKKFGLVGLALAILILAAGSEGISRIGQPAVFWPAECRPGLASEDSHLASCLLINPPRAESSDESLSSRGKEVALESEGSMSRPSSALVKSKTRVAAVSGTTGKTSTKSLPAASRTASIDNNDITSSRSNINKASSVLTTARQFLGVSYLYGGESPSGFDCSGFTRYVFRQYGVHLPRSAQEQSSVGVKVSPRELAPGDLLFFNTEKSGRINHVGIYMGDNKFIHASRTSGITITLLTDSYYQDKMITARRVLR